MAQQVLVDLNLNQNFITELADGVNDTDAINLSQLNDAIAAIEGDIAVTSHVAASGVDAILVGPTDQVVSLLLNSPELSQGPSGVAIDLSGLATDAELTTEVNARIAGDEALDLRIDGLEGLDHVAAVSGSTAIAVDLATQAVSLVVDPASTELTQGASGLTLDLAAYATDADLTGYVTTDTYTTGQATQDTAIGTKADKVVTVTAGNGLTGGGTLAGPDIPLSVLVSGATGNQVTVDASGVYVPAPGAVSVPVQDVEGTAGEITVSDAAGVYTVGIDPTYTAAVNAYADAAVAVEAGDRAAADTALQTEVDAVETGLAQEILDRTAADAVLQTNIDAINVLGTGMAVVTEAPTGTFTVDVPALQLSNTYSGTTGVDTGTIDTEIAPADAEPGDLYINTATGQAFISNGTVWTELATASVGIDSIASGDGSITVTNGAGPNADIALSAALQAEIAASTTTNTAQDTAIAGLVTADTTINARIDAVEAVNVTQTTDIDAIEVVNTGQDAAILALQGADAGFATDIADLEAVSHVPAVGANAIAVDLATQAVTLVIDPLSGAALSQSGTGLLFTAPASAKKFAADVTTLSGTGTVTHGLGTTDVVVSVKNAGGCIVTASVCVVDANSVSVEAADATYRVTVIG